VRFLGPILDALRDLGGTARPTDVREIIANRLQITEEEQSVRNKSRQSRFENQVHWARFYLMKAGYLSGSERGVWSLTDRGRNLSTLTPAQALTIFTQTQAAIRTPSPSLAPAPTAASHVVGKTGFPPELLERQWADIPTGRSM
jgi:restriction system protein